MLNGVKTCSKVTEVVADLVTEKDGFIGPIDNKKDAPPHLCEIPKASGIWEAENSALIRIWNMGKLHSLSIKYFATSRTFYSAFSI